MSRKALLTALLLALSSPAWANVFSQNAQSNMGGFTPPPQAPNTPPMNSPMTPPPAQPAPFPSSVPGQDATGFVPVPQNPASTQKTGTAPLFPGAKGRLYRPAPTPADMLHAPVPSTTGPGNVLSITGTRTLSNSPMPPPLPAEARAHNMAASNALSNPATVAPSNPASLGFADVKGSHVIQDGTDNIVVGNNPLANIAITVSGYAPNEILTPFHHPRLIYSEAGFITFIALGDKAIISVVPSHPVGAILTGLQPGDPTINLTFVPKKTPGRNYQLTIMHWHPNPVVTTATLTQSSRAAHLLSIMKIAAQQKIPNGYARERQLPRAQKVNNLAIHAIAGYVGGSHTLTEFQVRNTSAKPVLLSENDFYHPGVAAIAFWPSGNIAGHGKTSLFVLSDETHHLKGTIGFLGKE